METKEYPANSGAPSSTLQSYSDGVSETDSAPGILSTRPQLDTAFLAALLREGNRTKRVLEQVQEEDFHNPVYGALYGRIKAVANNGDLSRLRVLDALTATRWTTDSYWHRQFLDLVAPGDHEDTTVAASLLVQMSWRARIYAYGMELQQAAETLSVAELDALLASTRMEDVQGCRVRLAALEAMVGGVK